MNSFYKKINGLVFCALLISAFPLYSMESENGSDSIEECENTRVQNSEWNKQNIIVLFLLMTGLYACAVYQDKIASPAALWKRMFYSSMPEPIIIQSTIIEPTITEPAKEEPIQQPENDGYEEVKEKEDTQHNDDSSQNKVENFEVPAQHDKENDISHELDSQNVTKIKSAWNKFIDRFDAWAQSDMATE